ncbi:MAG TPA: glycosyltransferase family 4 protein [Aggregatilineales bacterium]|nr:glycosyltransferase family 4 protein [Anaerolineales bacterium]HRE46996.1 glycosyltransferase family 4 protein [Aggregatilineales bacterium]
MHIGIVTSWATDVIDGSGTAVFFNSFLGGLREQGVQVEVIAPNFDSTDYLTVTLQRFLFNAELRTDPRLRDMDVIIGFDYDGYALDAATRPPLIVSAHCLYADVVPWERDPIRTMVMAQGFYDQVNMERGDHVTVASAYGKQRIQELYGIPAEKITVIPHGFHHPSWFPYAEGESHQANDHPVILAVGKMFPRKRIELLLRAIPILQMAYPDVEVRIVGNGLEWDSLHELAATLKVEENLTWLSHLSDDRAFAREWQRADVFCHPSSQESFGYVYLEAMALGKPIVATNASAAPEVVGDAGLLVPPENPEALAEGILTFLNDTALRETYGQRGKERVRRFTEKAMIDGYLGLLNTLTHEPIG